MAGDAERRYIIGSGWQTVAVSASGIVTAADVDSDGAANGEVLTANGAGAATWEAGGGGSLPAWWTVDSTPGSESVEFGGAVSISPSASATALHLKGAVAQSAPFIDMTDSNDNSLASFASDGSLMVTAFAVTGGVFTADADGTLDFNGWGGIEPDGSTTFFGSMGFFGATPIAQPAAPADVNDVIAGLQALGLFAT